MKRNKQHEYTEEERSFIRGNVAGRSYAEMTELFNKTFNLNLGIYQISGTIKRLGLKNGRDCKFFKGQASHNKGQKGKRCNPATEFKKGNIPSNHRPVGSERVSVDGYIEVKVAEPRTWRLKQRVLWEQHNGAVPKGSALVFLDGNPLNCELENLVLISRAELLIANRQGLIKPDPELTKTGLVVAGLVSKIYEKQRAIEGR